MAKRCTGCGRLDTEPLGLNKDGEPYLACCPDNNYKEITAVDWLVEQYKKQGFLYDLDIEAANQLFEKQILDAICANQNGLLRRKTILEAKQYYQETFGSPAS